MQTFPQTDAEFQKLRNPLISYFAGRGLSPAEDYADEVIMRVIVKISEGLEIDNINKYVYGVAKFVRLESYKEPRTVSIDQNGALENDRDEDSKGKIPQELIVNVPVKENESIHSTCLKKCLGELKPEKREMLMSFYRTKEFDNTHIDKRREIAGKYNMSVDTLYTNICRTRKKVGDCTKKCAAK